jgi:transposase
VDAIRYLGRTGCQWDALPADFSHHKLVYHYFKSWTADGTLTRMHNHLRDRSVSRFMEMSAGSRSCSRREMTRAAG